MRTIGRQARLNIISGVSGIALIVLAAPAGAQAAPAEKADTAPAQSPEWAGATDDIVVTGQRRVSTVQNTAAAISVLTADVLAASGTDSSMGLQFATPGLVVSQDHGLQTQIFIRGIGSNLQGIATGNSVATYVDGVYIPNSIQSAQGFTDIERIEILKGPQATLYGRNATGGAIIIVSSDPEFEYGGAADISYGNYNSITAHARVNIPVISDRVAINIAGKVDRHDGYVKNLFKGTEIDYGRSEAIRGALKVVVSEDVEVVLRADYTHAVYSDVMKIYPRTASFYYTPPNTTTDTTPGPQFFSPDPRKVYFDVDPRNPSKDRGYSATIRWETPIGLLTSVSSRRLFDAGPFFGDSDGTPSFSIAYGVKINSLGNRQGSDSYYHDTYLSTDFQGPFNLIVGGNYFHDKEYSFDRSTIALADSYSKVEAGSLYTDANLDVTDTVKLTAGVRYSEETKSYIRTNFNRLTGAVASVESNRKSFHSTNPRFGIEWRPSSGLLLFATATSGFKSGGFNPGIPADDFSPEKIWSYETGLKTRLFDNRVRLAASAFYYDYSDIQVVQYVTTFVGVPPVASLAQQITNGATAKIWGLDADVGVKVTDNFSIESGLSLLHTEFGSSIFCDTQQGSCTSTNPDVRGDVDVNGNPLTRAPTVSANIAGEYRIPLASGEIKLRADGSYRSRVYYTPFKSNLNSSDPYWIFGASARYESNQNWFIEAYCQNITDKLAITNIITSISRNPVTGAPLVGTAGTIERYAPPRLYGLRIGFKY